ncbi:MAG: SDR family oxidoreductase, partial [Pseudomonadota bacterium]
RAVEAAVSKFGRLDAFIANAGMWDFMSRLVDLPEDERLEAAIDQVLSVNVKGCLLGARAAAAALCRSRGSLILTLSNASFDVAGGGPIYTASKHAGVGLVRQLAYELAPLVRVNGVAAGAASTRLSGPDALGLATQSIQDAPLAEFVPKVLPIGFLPEPEDYAGAYVFLASRRNARTATGSIVRVDGGMNVRGFPDAAGGADLAARFDDEEEQS